MEGEKIFMSQRQLQRLEVMGLVEVGRMKLKEAAERSPSWEYGSVESSNGEGGEVRGSVQEFRNFSPVASSNSICTPE
jgi:hypothetical protein